MALCPESSSRTELAELEAEVLAEVLTEVLTEVVTELLAELLAELETVNSRDLHRVRSSQK